MSNIRLSELLSDIGSEINLHKSSFSITYDDENDESEVSFIQVDNKIPSITLTTFST